MNKKEEQRCHLVCNQFLNIRWQVSLGYKSWSCPFEEKFKEFRLMDIVRVKVLSFEFAYQMYSLIGHNNFLKVLFKKIVLFYVFYLVKYRLCQNVTM